jgi:hypothetical protein
MVERLSHITPIVDSPSMRIDEPLPGGDLGQGEQQHPSLRQRHALDFAGMRGEE